LQNLAEIMPDSCDLYESGLVDTFYPQRPGELEDCCLYNFKKWYKPNGYDVTLDSKKNSSAAVQLMI